MLSATIGDLAGADRHFALAAAEHDRIGAPAWLARTRLEWAGALLAEPTPGRGDAARSLLHRALDAGRALGATTVARRAEMLLGPG